MEKKIEAGLMLDFYGQLLTVRQEEILHMYYDHDLSLGEIAENLSITRQGVYDNIKRAEKVLYNMESKLGLVKRFLEQRYKLEQALNIVNEVEDELKSRNMKETFLKINSVKNMLESITEH